jgi:hypothetical protein
MYVHFKRNSARETGLYHIPYKTSAEITCLLNILSLKYVPKRRIKKILLEFLTQILYYNSTLLL